MKKKDRYTGHRYAKPNRSSENDIYSNSDRYARTTGNKKYKKRKKKWSAKKKIIVTLCIILGIILMIAGIVFAYIKATLSQLGRVPLPEAPETLGISSEVAEKYKDLDVTNIALFGVDSREDNDIGRSDALMILSIDRVHNKIKLTSIARDTYVTVDGYGQTKINHAYAYEGPELAIKTINENFDMNIQGFVTVNFSQLAEIIDYLGGINIAVTEEEREVANRLIQELGVQCEPITESGESVHLTGDQAVIFARNRDTGGDSERTGRQRKVLSAMFDQAKAIDVTQYPGLINMVLSQSVTSLSDNDMLGIGTWAVTSGATMEQLSLPNENCNASGEMIDGVWYYVYDLDLATDLLHDFIYEENSAD